jgi:hypothetical protein
MFEKVDVNGSNAHPVWVYLKAKQGGLLGKYRYTSEQHWHWWIDTRICLPFLTPIVCIYFHTLPVFFYHLLFFHLKSTICSLILYLYGTSCKTNYVNFFSESSGSRCNVHGGGGGGYCTALHVHPAFFLWRKMVCSFQAMPLNGISRSSSLTRKDQNTVHYHY